MTKLKRYQVFLADRAKQDIREIHDYIVMNFYSQQSADGKVDLILTALETLEIFPEACPLVSSRGYGEMTDDGKTYRYMPIENYLAFYYIENHTVFVARILSAKQDWVKISRFKSRMDIDFQDKYGIGNMRHLEGYQI